MLEVEQKFRVADLTAFASKLREMGGEIGEAVLQVDRYFNHPARNFADTDEALRIRQVGDKNFVTYKGPKLDTTTKTRREIEVPIAEGAAAARDFGELLTLLGFRHVADIRKCRCTAELERNGYRVEAVLDEVEGLGFYVELECVVEDQEADSAKRCIGELAESLGLGDSERKSYLELLLDRR